MDKKYFLQIDLIKAYAIISVILLHTISYEVGKCLLIETFANFHIWQAVPIFLIIMGLNMGMSFQRLGLSKLNEIYTKEYFISRFYRIFFPFIIIFILSMCLGLLKNYMLGEKSIYLGYHSILGQLPTTGPGNYFISIIFQFIILFPIIYRIFVYNPKLMLLICFILDFSFQLTAPYISIFVDTPYLYSANIFRYLSAIALGLWISNNFSVSAKRNRFILFGSILSMTYLFAYNISSYQFPYFLHNWKTQNILSFFYPSLLVMIGMKILPTVSKNRILIFLGFIGKASYHIFLFQILYFASGFKISKLMAIFGYQIDGISALFLAISVNLIMCISIGMLFFLYEKKIIRLFFKPHLNR